MFIEYSEIYTLSNDITTNKNGGEKMSDRKFEFIPAVESCGGEMKVAFALYPVSMKQLIDIADTGNIMPPKTTWFEPKLRSGIVIHSFKE